jgi:hypothetical protein
MEPNRMTPDEIDDLARRIVTNEVFITNTEDGIRNAFTVVLAFTEIPEDYAAAVSAIWAPMSAAMPRSVNGWPTFDQANFVHRDDWDALATKIEAKRTAVTRA